MTAVYLDHAASTTPRPAALAELRHWLEQPAANASSAHAAGRSARVAVEEARERVATVLAVAPSEVVFTSGGTEADNLAVKGSAWAGAERGRRHLVVSAVEHPAVLEPARWLVASGGFALDVVPPDPDGRVPLDRVLAAVREDTALVSVMAANNELGAINDVVALGTALRAREVPFHTDAVQAFATLDVAGWPVDALSLSAHKFGGPQGVGIAVLRRGVPIVPLTHGGGQDRGVRSGTFAAALDAACAVAVAEAALERPQVASRTGRLGDRLAAGLLELDGVVRRGPSDAGARLPSHVAVTVDGVDGEELTFALDRAGVYVSAGAACAAGARTRSPVLEACGIEADAALRLSLGWSSTVADVDHALDVLHDVIPALRRSTTRAASASAGRP